MGIWRRFIKSHRKQRWHENPCGDFVDDDDDYVVDNADDDNDYVVDDDDSDDDDIMQCLTVYCLLLFTYIIPECKVHLKRSYFTSFFRFFILGVFGGNLSSQFNKNHGTAAHDS